jgi:hypothetical protein
VLADKLNIYAFSSSLSLRHAAYIPQRPSAHSRKSAVPSMSAAATRTQPAR